MDHEQVMNNYSELKRIELMLSIYQSTKEFWKRNEKEKQYHEMRKKQNG
jgi:hypothetical protein